MELPPFRHVVIVGVGLIGGSVALGLRKAKAATKVTGIDRSDNLPKVEPLVDGATDDLSAVSDADLVVLATPISVTLEVLPRLSALVSPDCVVTDTASTKAEIARIGNLHLGGRFVPGHPMAGSENGGTANARGDLFNNSVWAICAGNVADVKSVEEVKRLSQLLGANPFVMTETDAAEMHDRTVAITSHLPHLLAYALATQGAEVAQAQPVRYLSAGGWQSMTRTAASDPNLWTEILRSNREHILSELHEYRLRLADLEDALSADDKATLLDILREGHDSKWKLAQ